MKMIKKLKKLFGNEKGFTLIELIVVIAVLGMISAIAIPKIGDITSRAKDASDKQTIVILNEATERYNAENGEQISGENAKDVVESLQSDTNNGPYLDDNIEVNTDNTVKLPSGDKLYWDKDDKKFIEEEPNNTNDEEEPNNTDD